MEVVQHQAWVWYKGPSLTAGGERVEHGARCKVTGSSGKVDYPATSMSGTWTAENMYTGYSTTESISMTPFYAEPKMSRSRDNKDYLAEAIENSKSVRKLDDISTIKIRNGKISAVTK